MCNNTLTVHEQIHAPARSIHAEDVNGHRTTIHAGKITIIRWVHLKRAVIKSYLHSYPSPNARMTATPHMAATASASSKSRRIKPASAAAHE